MTDPVSPSLAAWLDRRIGPEGPWHLEPLTGGNSNDTGLLCGASSRYVMRRPPRHALSTSAHSVSREYRLLTALWGTAVPVPRPVALCEDPGPSGVPFMVMEYIPDARSITDALPRTWSAHPDALTAAADDLVDALVATHRVDWAAVGLSGFGRPEGFLERQPGRWFSQWEKIACRPLPAMVPLAEWLVANRPATSAVGLLHGDFHLDNCLFAADRPRVKAVIDWEMATVGDPLLDLGLLLALWGERRVDCGMPAIQAVSRAPCAPPREHLLERYERGVGRSVPDVGYYRVLALFKLASIVESAYAQFRSGRLDTPYAAALEQAVPALLDEALETATSTHTTRRGDCRER